MARSSTARQERRPALQSIVEAAPAKLDRLIHERLRLGIVSALAANELGRRLFLDGHRHVLAVEAAGETTLAQTLRESAARYAADAVVDSGYAKDVVSAVANGVTAIVCDSVLAARTAMEALKVAEISIPAQVSVAAIGRADADVPCSGCFLHSADEAAAVARLLEPAAANARPTTLWLHGRQMDRGTIAPVVTAPLLQIPQFDLQLNAAP